MGLFKKSGIYYVSLTIDGKRIQRSLHTKSKAIAEDCWHLLLKEKFLGSNLMSLFKSPETSYRASKIEKQDDEHNRTDRRFNTQFKDYIQYCIREGQTKSTITHKQWTLKILIENKIITYDDFNSSKFDAFWIMCKDSFRPDTTRKFSAVIKAFLNYSIKKGWFDRQDFDKLIFPKLKTKPRDVVLSLEDWERIKTHLKGKDDEFLLYLSILFYAGLRPTSEAFKLSQTDIDYEKGSVRVYQSKTKNYKTVFFPPAILEECRKIAHEKLFIRPLRSETFFTHKFNALKKSLNLNPRLVLYSLRHSFASHLMAKTGNIHLVAKQLGHSGIELAHSTYVHLGDHETKNQVEILWQDEPKNSTHFRKNSTPKQMRNT